METKYIKNLTNFKCTIDNITYDCFLEFKSYYGDIATVRWCEASVRRYITKKWWICKWKSLAFEAYGRPDIKDSEYIYIDDEIYFTEDTARRLVKHVLNNQKKPKKKVVNVVYEI